MKNDRTPRTLADCEFTVGYPQRQESTATRADYAVLLLAAIFIGLIVWGIV